MLDTFGRPGRKFYDALSMMAKDEKEKKELEHLMSKEGKNDFMKLIKETVTFADLLLKFPSAMPSLEYLV